MVIEPHREAGSMTVFSFKTLALGWAGLCGAAAIGAGVLQASYVPPLPQPVVVAPAELPQAQAASPAPTPAAAAVPFENRSLLAMLPPPGIRPHPATHPAAVVAEPLPVPPVPPVRVARVDPPRRVARSMPEPTYVAEAPSYPGWGWGRRLPYPGQYASGRAYYYGGQPGDYGW